MISPEKKPQFILSQPDTVGLYLDEIGQYSLLSEEKEKSLAESLIQAREAELRLEEGNLTLQEKENLERIVEEGESAGQTLVLANLRLVVNKAKRYQNLGVPFLDLIQEGNLGLMEALDEFELIGFRFSTYAGPHIQRRILEAISKQSRIISIPSYMHDILVKLERLRRAQPGESHSLPPLREMVQRVIDAQRCLSSPERAASLPEAERKEMKSLLAYLGIKPTEARYLGFAFEADREPLSLGPPGEKSLVPIHLIEDPNSSQPEQVIELAELKRLTQENLGRILPRLARALRLLYGLKDDHCHSRKEAAQKLGVTPERIRQIQTKALKILRNPRLWPEA